MKKSKKKEKEKELINNYYYYWSIGTTKFSHNKCYHYKLTMSNYHHYEKNEKKKKLIPKLSLQHLPGLKNYLQQCRGD